VTPVKTDTRFKPVSRSYMHVISDLPNQNYEVLPSVIHISPPSGAATGGTTVTITGTGFSGATAVTFGSAGAAAFTVNSPTHITATSPTGSVGLTVDITVTTPAGTSATSSADRFTYANVAKNISTGTLYMGLASALAAAHAGNEIRILDTQLDGDFILDKSITLFGGWDSTFLSPGAQPTEVNGNLTVEGGTSTVRAVVVNGELEVHTGSLQVNGVTIGQY
jgi:hypothetical protein